MGETVILLDFSDELRLGSDPHHLDHREPIPSGLQHRQRVKRQSGPVVRLIVLKIKHSAAAQTHGKTPPLTCEPWPTAKQTPKFTSIVYGNRNPDCRGDINKY